MKTTALRFICYIILLVGLMAGLAGFAQLNELEQQPRSHNQEILIDYSGLAQHFGELDRPDSEDQLRDWAVLGTLAELGLDDDTLMKATYRTPPIRLPYLEDAFVFEHGRGRFALVGERDVLIFHDANDPDPMATDARTADRVRQEIGEIPETFNVYSFRTDLNSARIVVKREQVVTGTDMFSPRWGYLESSVTDASTLEKWLGTVDYLSHARKQDGLVLGGRRFKNSRGRNLTLEDAAAVYQAHAELQKRRSEHKDEVQELKTEMNKELLSEGVGTDLPPFSREVLQSFKQRGIDLDLVQRRSRRKDEILEKYQKRARNLELGPADPGFSLDPQWNIPELIRALTALRTDPCKLMPEESALAPRPAEKSDALSLVRWAEIYLGGLTRELSSLELQKRCQELEGRFGERIASIAKSIETAPESQQQEEALALLALEMELRDKPNPDLVDAMLRGFAQLVRAKYQAQCARYDGPLKGTTVGMNLFYTDLVAKVWLGVDYYRSAPLMAVPGFLSLPRMSTETTYSEETNRLNSTRIWFGPKPEAISRAEDGSDAGVFFSPTATRVYSAGTDPLQPGKEEQPNEPSRRAIGFWDRNFSDIADYEPEYQVQNEIIKWSLLSAWMLEQKLGEFLSTVGVDRSKEFPTWFSTNKQLKFRERIPFLPQSAWISGTECMERLHSYPFESNGNWRHIEGGVSVGGQQVWDRAPKISRLKPRSLRADLSESAALGSKEVGTATRARPRLLASGKSVVEANPATRFRAGGVSVRLGSVEMSAVRRKALRSLSLTSDRGLIGEVSLRVQGSKVSLDWRPGPVQRAQTLVANLTKAAEEDSNRPFQRVLGLRFSDNDAVVLRRTPETALLKVTSGEPRPEPLSLAHGTVNLPRSRGIAHDSDGKLTPIFRQETVEVRVDLIDGTQANSLLDGYDWLALSIDTGRSSATDRVVRTLTKNTPNDAASFTIEGMGGTSGSFEARVSTDGTFYVKRSPNGRQLDTWYDFALSERFGPHDLEWAKTEVLNRGAKTIQIGEFPSQKATVLFQALHDGDLRIPLREMAARPDSVDDVVSQLRGRTNESAIAALMYGDATKAVSLFDFAEEILASSPSEHIVERGIAEMSAGLPSRAARRLNDVMQKGPGIREEERALGLDLLAADSRNRNSEARAVLSDALLGKFPNTQVELAANSGRLKPIFRTNRPLRGERIDVAEIEMNADHYVIYLEDAPSFNRFDAEHDFHGTVAELRNLPRVSWEVVVESDVAAYRPAMLVDAQERRFLRIGRDDVSRPSSDARKIVVIRSCSPTCDCDGNGTVDERERANCRQ